jgi:hypothetical protein
MKNNTEPLSEHSKTNHSSLLLMCCTSLTGVTVQTVFLREYLAIFSGNEFIIGMTWALWMLATAFGTFMGTRVPFYRNLFPSLYIISILAGLLLIRAFPLLFTPGQMLPPWSSIICIVLTQSDTAFFCGLVFSALAQSTRTAPLYMWENMGSLIGLGITSLLLIFNAQHIYILCLVLLIFSVAVLNHKPFFLVLALILLTAILFVNSVSISWKYASSYTSIQNGISGEIAKTGQGDSLCWMLNNRIYKSTTTLPLVEQSVHLPIAMSISPVRSVLLIENTGQLKELQRYPALTVDCVETEPFFREKGYHYLSWPPIDTSHYDLVLCGASIPITAADIRYFTDEFFRKVHMLTGSYGCFSFTLQLSENYLTPEESSIKDNIQTTLKRSFRTVKIIPGYGYTFIASDNPLIWPVTPHVATHYLEPYTLQSLTSERIIQAQQQKDTVSFSTRNKPSLLLFSQKQWFSLTGASIPILFIFSILLILAGISFIQKDFNGISVATSGFIAGVYSVALMFMYQCTYGTLYSNLALLMIALMAGFVLGSRCLHFRYSDLVIGFYSSNSLILIMLIPHPPLLVFLLLNFGIGTLVAAQFVTRTNSNADKLFASDLAGGVCGTLLCSSIIIPTIGIINLAIGLLAVKAGTILWKKLR